ncbi:MAG: TIGR03905 family TSCPD domain-containing protein [Muribaculaceae bacterium]|nr:TIGR03905 family TSCPD domain-containing protein [Muribaculaceae bacterium]
MKQFSYMTEGTCSQMIVFELDDEQRLHHVQFVGGCAGNTTGISLLVEGQKAEDVMHKLRGVRCGYKATSCPDQLSRAIEQAITAAPEQ